MSTLIERFKNGDISALSKLISMVEADNPDTNEIIDEIYSMTGHAHVIGITGPPGGGKSTLVDKLIRIYQRRGISGGPHSH
jgi:LAO/AO transport system kinase